MTNQVSERLLRMAEIASKPAMPEKVVTDKTGIKRIIPAKPAKSGIIGFSAKHIYHLIKCQQFPKPIKVGRASLWRLSDINAWIEEQDSAKGDRKWKI